MKRNIIILVAVVCMLAAAVVPTQAAGNCAQFYQVRRGDTLARIARAYGTSWSYLANINGLANPNRIFAGQFLCVSVYTPPPPPQNFYVVQRGDWLSRIAQRFGVSLFSLIQANSIINPNLIYPGQVLTIPVAY